jgi:hypothetical protein
LNPFIKLSFATFKKTTSLKKLSEPLCKPLRSLR